MVPQFAQIIRGPVTGNNTCFLSGPLVAGQRQAHIERIQFLLDSGVAGYSLLVLLPDRATVRLFREQVNRRAYGPHSDVEFHTYYSLAVRLTRLFWPIVASDAGFAFPHKPPIFLNYETAQYVLGTLVEPLLAQGYFEGLAIRPQRAISQLLDNANKAAIGGFPLSDVGVRLQKAWVGEDSRLRYYEQVQYCIELMRGHCLQHGLLDASLVFQVFDRHLLGREEFWRYFTGRYRHLLVDSVDEMVPIAHDLIDRLLPRCDSALLSGDRRGGFRIFLGADADGCVDLAAKCREHIEVNDEDCVPRAMASWAGRIGEKLGQGMASSAGDKSGGAVVDLIRTPYRAQMVDAVAQRIVELTERGVAPGDIAIVAPHADGVLRFLLAEALGAAEIPFAIVRRYEALREEPIVRACLSLAILSYRTWDLSLNPYDLEEAFVVALATLDRLRAALLVGAVYDEDEQKLRAVAEIDETLQRRVGSDCIGRYEALRHWVQTYAEGDALPFDHFLRRLFGEVLAGPHLAPDSAAAYSKLIASAQAFRRAGPALGLDEETLGARYSAMVTSGVVAAQHVAADVDLQMAPESIALVAPVHTYLLSGHVARFQFWLDVGSLNWWDALHQPLTNHYVLARRWNRDERWTDAVDYSLRNRNLHRLVRGLSLRCSEGIYLCTSEREGRGEVQDSPLLMAIQQVLQEDR